MCSCTRLFRALLALALVAVFTVGCGGGGGFDETPPPSTGAPGAGEPGDDDDDDDDDGDGGATPEPGGPSGDPANILTSVQHSQIFVRGVGHRELTTYSLNIVDAQGRALNETQYGNPSANNVRVTVLTAPDAVSIAGINGSGNTVVAEVGDAVEVRSVNGQVVVHVQSGTAPGVIELRAEAILNATGGALSPTVQATLPMVVVASGPPHAISLTHPQTNSIEDLGAGVYRRIGKALVNDRWGNPVPDGTAIQFALMDTVIAQGADAVTSEGDNQFVIAAGDLLAASVLHDGGPRWIETGDHVLISSAMAADKIRRVANLTGPLSMETSANYANYATNQEYVIGSATRGGSISGLGSDDQLLPGTAVTKDGVATFYVTYPANSNTIRLGCGDYATANTLYSPPESAQVWVTAYATTNAGTLARAATVNAGQFCFSSIAGWTLEAIPETISDNRTISLELWDGGDEVRLPFVPLTYDIVYTANDGGLDVQVAIDGSGRTGANGHATSTVTLAGGASGDSATITYRAGEASATVTVRLP